MSWGGLVKYHQKTKTYKINLVDPNKDFFLEKFNEFILRSKINNLGIY